MIGWLEGLGSKIGNGVKKIPGGLDRLVNPEGGEIMPRTGGFAGGDPAGDILSKKIPPMPQRQGMPMPQQNSGGYSPLERTHLDWNPDRDMVPADQWNKAIPRTQMQRSAFNTMEVRLPNNPNFRPGVDGGEIRPIPLGGRGDTGFTLMGSGQSPNQTMPAPIAPMDIKPSREQVEGPRPLPSALNSPSMLPMSAVPSMRANGVTPSLTASGLPDINDRNSPVTYATNPSVRSMSVQGMNERNRITDEPRSSVPIPNLPSMRGGTQPYTDRGAAQYDYVMQDAKPNADGQRVGKIQRNKVTIAQNALLGAANAGRNNPEGGLGAMLGGALGGASGAAINPEAGRLNVFNAGPGRRMDEETAKQQGLTQHQLEQERIRKNNEHLDAQTRHTNAQTDAMADDQYSGAAWGTYNKKTGQPGYEKPAGIGTQARPRRYNIDGALVDDEGKVIYQGTPKTKPMTLAEAEAQRADEEGGTVEEIAQSSFDDPGRQAAIRGKLSKEDQGLLDGTIKPDKSRLPTDYQKILANPNDANLLALDQNILTKAEIAADKLIQ